MLTPLEYRARIRLQEARRLMLVADLDAASIGLAVGYETVAVQPRVPTCVRLLARRRRRADRRDASGRAA